MKHLLTGSVVISNYADRIPVWMSNRPKDVYTVSSVICFGADVTMTVDDDINLLKKIRAYRGIRHETGQKSVVSISLPEEPALSSV